LTYVRQFKQLVILDEHKGQVLSVAL